MKNSILASLLFSLCFALVILSGLGEINISAYEVLMSTNVVAIDSTIFWDLRVPRALLSALVGGALALSGAVMQGIFRNPLADPGLVGVSAGSALGASFAIVFGSFIFSNTAPIWWLPFCAFLCGLLIMLIVYRLAKQGEHTQVATLLLAGVALSALCTALSALLIYVSNDQQLRSLSFWQMGSFSGSSWSDLLLCLIITLPAISILLLMSSQFNYLLLGEAQARHLGVSVERLKLFSLVLVSLVVSISVAMVGVIGFVGLVVPHIIRLLFGADHRFLLPASFLLGALLLLFADTFSRLLISPSEIPIGIVTALIGCPFFLYLLIQHRKQILF